MPTKAKLVLLFVMSYAVVASAQTITHIIYIIKENRTLDQYFGAFSGVQGQCLNGNTFTGTTCFIGNNTPCGSGICTNSSYISTLPSTCTGISGSKPCYAVNKQRVSNANPYGEIGYGNAGYINDGALLHSRWNSLTAINGGKMNGWQYGGHCSASPTTACNTNFNCTGTGNYCLSNSYFYVDSDAIPWYYSMSSTYGLADQFFSTNSGPSYPNHFYIFAATGHEASDNPTGGGSIWGCGQQGSSGTAPAWNNANVNGKTYTSTNYSVCAKGDPFCGPAGDRLAAGTGYSGGVCSNNSAIACACYCPSGKYVNAQGTTACTLSNPCANDGISATACGSGNTCSLSSSIGNTPGAPCPFVTTIADVLESQNKTWKYYSSSPSWDAASYVPQLYFRDGTGGKNAFSYYNPPSSQFVTDVSTSKIAGMCSNNNAMSCSKDSDCGVGNACVDNGSFPNVAFIAPDSGATSEHGSQFIGTCSNNSGINCNHNSDCGTGNTCSTAIKPSPLNDLQQGEAWTKSLVNAVMANPYLYYHSVIFITWDDFGGTADHVAPPSQDALTLGMRVPLLAIGPYVKNQVTHTSFEFASVLKCVEDLFGTGNINSRDTGATDVCAGTGTLSSNTDGMINTSQTPIPPN